MRILVVVAHPDDEILGCGGTIARLVREGHEANVLILGEGVTSRDKQRNLNKRRKEINTLGKQAHNANQIIGTKNVFLCDFADNRFDTVALLDIVKMIEEVKNKVKPEIVFTHFKNDLNIDHKITFEATVTATRPLPNETVKELYSFEVLSSTDCRYPLSFLPNTFFDVSKTINLKLKALKQYKSEIRDFPHPRSIEGLKLNAQTWGMKVGVKHAEAFKTVRCIK